MYSSWTLQLPRTSICYTQTKWQKLEIYLLPVQCLTSASKGQSLHISSFGPTECKDTLLGKHVKWQRVDACILKFLLNVLFTFKRLQSMLRSNGIVRYLFGNKLCQNVCVVKLADDFQDIYLSVSEESPLDIYSPKGTMWNTKCWSCTF